MSSTPIIGGRFVIEGLAGSGGMGEVHRARDLATGGVVAVKLLQGRDLGDFERFLREARVLAELRHPGVVRYVAQGTDPQPYLVMEWLEGHDLATELEGAPRLSVVTSLTMLRAAAAALASVHARGIVHRDLKPANLFLVGGRAEDLRVIDFGIARRNRGSMRLTDSNGMIGTPGYMAPEQVREPLLVDARADIFALGCVLFECLGGAPPFSARQSLAVLAKLLLEEAPRIGELRPDVPAALEDLLERMLRKDPAGRPADATALLAELDALDAHDGGPVLSRRPPILTSGEQHLTAVLLVGAGESEDEEIPVVVRHDPTLVSAGVSRVRALVEPGMAAVGQRHGAEVDRLLDGTLVVTFDRLVATGPEAAASAGKPALSAATDQAARAARCALEVRALFPARPLALAMGRRQRGRPGTIGSLIDRAVGLLLGSRGALRIDGLSAGLLDTRFEVEATEEGLWLSGERPVVESARLLVGRVAPFVGRENELALLRGLLQAPSPSARAVLVTGEPGVGKSRLCHELLRWVEGQGAPLSIWVARGDPMRAGAPLGILGEIVRHAAQIVAGEPPAARREKLSGRVARHLGADRAPRVAELLGEIAGAPFPEQTSPELAAVRLDPMRMADQMRRAWVDFLGAECAEQPVLLVLEDLHWGDRATTDFIDAALRALKDEPLLVLALARPEIGALFPDLWRGRSVTEIRLGGLSRRACGELAREVLGAPGSDAAEVLWERSEGNPFLLEELLRAQVEGRVDGLPETALAMVQSRLEGVSPASRRVLRAASIFGRLFWRGALAVLLGEGEAAELDAHLAELTRREWIVPRPDGRFRGEDEYMFLHDLMRDAAYQMLTEEDRRLGHALAGEWLELSGETDAMTLAAHFERGDETIRASALYFEAATLALRGNDVEGAVSRASRGLTLDAAGLLREELLATLIEAHLWQNDWSAAAAPADELFLLAAPGSRGFCVAVLAKLSAALMGGQVGSFVEVLGPIAVVEPAPGAAPHLVQALANALFALHFAGAHDVAARYLVRLHEVAGPVADDPAVAAWVSFAEGFRARFAEMNFTASRRLSRAAELGFEQAENQLLARWCRTWVANDSWLVGDHALALELLERREAGGHRTTALASAVARLTLASALADVGRLTQARVEAEALVAAEDGPGRGPYFQGLGRTLLSEILRRCGDLAGAEEQAVRARSLLESYPAYHARASARLAAVRLDQGDVEGAVTLAREAYQQIKDTPAYGDMSVRLVRARALEAAGEHAAAASAIHAARAELLRRAARLDEPAARESFLERVPDHAAVLSLARLLADQAESRGR